MKKHWGEVCTIGISLVLWRLLLGGVEWIAPHFWPVRPDFLGLTTAWANFDGAHYTSIAKHGYGTYQYAFFPLYPLLIRVFSMLSGLPYEQSAVSLSHAAFFMGIILFWRYLEGSKGRAWTVLFLLFFPTSFFFVSAYSESLFFALTSAVLLLMKRKQWLLAGVFAALASATRLVGVFLIFPLLVARRWTAAALAPLGLVLYMGYLWVIVRDPLAFFHVQPAFGAGRSGGAVIFLPQVLWRYVKIFLTVSPRTYAYHVAVLEIGAFALGAIVLFAAWKRRYKPGILLYGIGALLLPTLTGTLSSMPRYILALFPLFTVFGATRSVSLKLVLLIVFFAMLVYAATAFLQGHFLS